MTLGNRSRIALAGVITTAFAALAASLPPSGGLPADIAVARGLQGLFVDRGAIVATWVSWLGDTALTGFLAAAVLMLFYRRRPAAAVTVAFATVGGMLLNAWLKPVFHRPRPDYALELIAGPTWSFPSGHAMASIIGYGVIVYFRLELEQVPWRRRVILVAPCAMIVAVGFSRLYLGVHYLSDVLGGFLAGALWLMACIEAYRWVRARRPVALR